MRIEEMKSKTGITINKVMSDILLDLGWTRMSKEVLKETNIDTLKKYANVIIKSVSSDLKERFIINFKHLGLR